MGVCDVYKAHLPQQEGRISYLRWINQEIVYKHLIHKYGGECQKKQLEE